MRLLRLRGAALAAVSIASWCLPAHAGEACFQLGLPGAGLGYAQPISPGLTVRGDCSTLGTRERNRTEKGARCCGRGKADRAGLFLGWFPLGGAFRTALGITQSNFRLDLDASGKGLGEATVVGATTARWVSMTG